MKYKVIHQAKNYSWISEDIEADTFEWSHPDSSVVFFRDRSGVRIPVAAFSEVISITPPK